ncbi:DUF2567 domain-containing protein [Gandjariella thermophila]|uniref:DUF2567 domain-containing protein n=1 Tax=Gandjariella thermophila TaxID=1931992 RepID=A0A4D4JEM7_9PSEU|nr:DUF2567 domain-containing protein [Gandjariella thermophila]GDY32789.1 hypothetical protein GTS_44220 [Gandjariella thermophila]
MAEQPVWNRGEPALPTGLSDPAHPMVIPWPRRRPAVVVRADLRFGLGVFVVVALLGVPIGLLWSRLAPPQRMAVLPSGSLVPENSESYHRFDDLALFGLIGLAAGLVVAVALWLLRRRRGPVALVAAVAGSALGAWLAMRTGLFFAGHLYPPGALPPVGGTVLRAPQLNSGWGVLAQPLAAAFVYGTLVAWNGADDLGRPG